MAGTTQPVRVGPLDRFNDAQPYRVETDGSAVVLVRLGENVYALQDRCSHQNVPLSQGEVYGDDGEIECYKHGSTFSLSTGEALSLPATQPVPRYEVTIEEGEVTLWIPTG